MDGSNRDKYLSCLSQANGFKCYMYENLSNTLSIRYRFIAKKSDCNECLKFKKSVF